MTWELLGRVVMTYVLSTLPWTTIASADGEGHGIFNPMEHQNWKLFDTEKCGHISSSDRIIGGYTAALGAYPWLARLGYVTKSFSGESSPEPEFRCGGTLITKFYILTAAHCTIKDPIISLEVIRLGEFDDTTDPDCDSDGCADEVADYKVVEVINHNRYDTPIFRNDISLIRVSQEIQFTKFVRPICMPMSSLLTKNFIGQTAEVAGWGVIDTVSRAVSSKLQALKIPMVDIALCMKHFNAYVPLANYSQMCAGGNYKEDSCSGDSGGPLMKIEAVDNYPPRYYIIGVVSFGAKKCAVENIPAVYTNVAHFMSWMLEQMKP